MSDRQVKKNTVQGYISFKAQRDLAAGQVKIKVYLSTGQVNILRFFYPWLISYRWYSLIPIQTQFCTFDESAKPGYICSY